MSRTKPKIKTKSKNYYEVLLSITVEAKSYDEAFKKVRRDCCVVYDPKRHISDETSFAKDIQTPDFTISDCSRIDELEEGQVILR
jgi:hypothetical protein